MLLHERHAFEVRIETKVEVQIFFTTTYVVRKKVWKSQTFPVSTERSR